VKPSAAVAVVCLALAAPAVAGEDTHVIKRSWHVELNYEQKLRVAPGDTFRHCPGDDVTRLYFAGRMVHPGRKGVDYHIVFTGKASGGAIYTSTDPHGWIRQSFAVTFIPEEGMRDGRWGLRIHLDEGDEGWIGRSSIRLKTVDGPGC
jgi:hypothetical protein